MIERSETKKTIIECECCVHLLQIQSETDFFKEDDNPERYNQQFYLSMFSYGEYREQPTFLEKLKISWRYMKSGKMHDDQLIMNPEEANKLANFIHNNLQSEK